MSKETKKANSGFTTGGYEAFPSIYADNKLVSEFSVWEQDKLEARAGDYTAFLQRDDLMPRAKAGAERALDHILFELAYRDGIYE